MTFREYEFRICIIRCYSCGTFLTTGGKALFFPERADWNAEILLVPCDGIGKCCKTAAFILIEWFSVAFFVVGVHAGSRFGVVCFDSMVVRSIYDAHGSKAWKVWYQIVIVDDSPAVVNKPVVPQRVIVIASSRHAEGVQDDIFTRSNFMVSQPGASQRSNCATERVTSHP